jgi:myxalamid-type nonribosomal peptide synthetase MxaA
MVRSNEPFKSIDDASTSKLLLPVCFNQERALLAKEIARQQSLEVPPSLVRLGIRLRGRLDCVVLKLALREVLSRHEGLRARFFANLALPPAEREARLNIFARTGLFWPGMHLQSISRFCDLEVETHDLSSLEPTLRHVETQQLCNRFAERPMRYDEPPLIRAHLIKLDEYEHVLVIVVDHIVVDAWSLRLVFEELSSFYSHFAGTGCISLTGPTLPYSDFALWEAKASEKGEFSADVTYWREQWVNFGGARVSFDDLPFAMPAPPRPTFSFGNEILTLGPSVSRQIRDFAANCRASVHMVFLTAYSILLNRITNNERLAIWGHFANRVRAELRQTVAPVFNSHIIGVDLSSDPTGLDLLDQVRSAVLGAYAHQSLPLPELWRQLKCHPRNCDAIVLLDSRRLQASGPIKAGRELEMERIILPATEMPRFSNLGMYITGTADGMGMQLRFSKDRFRDGRVRRLLPDLKDVVLALTSKPEAKLSEYPAQITRGAAGRSLRGGGMDEFVVLGLNRVRRVRQG